MIPSRLLRQAVTVVRPGVVTDRYGTETLDWSTATRTQVRGYLQPRQGAEDETGRSLQVSTALLYLPPDTDLTGRDRVEVEGQSYEVLGPPQVVYRLATAHHLLAEVQAEEG